MPASLHLSRSLSMFAVMAIVVAAWAESLPAQEKSRLTVAKPGETAPRFFEMRIYTTPEGKLEALNARFRDHTNRLFVKHGISLIGYWTPTDGPEAKNTLVYILAFPSREAREKSWEAFRKDPEWHAARDASEKNGKLVEKVESKFLAPTDYSPIK